MTLRKAKIDDHWRHMLSRQYSTKLISIRVENLLCISDADISIPKGICAIVGGNGVGKSALLAAISELLGNSECFHGVGHKIRLINSTLAAAVSDKGQLKNLTARSDEVGGRQSGEIKFDSGLHWLEPSYIVNVTQKKLSEDSAFHELLDSVSPIVMNDEDKEALWYILGKKVVGCKIFEVADYGDMDPFPYFIMESGGKSYGSESMGFGELSLLSIYWRLRTVGKNEILILEEPEAHVSPRSQRALMDLIARACDEKGLTVILTTHSPSIIANLPQENLVLLTKDGSKTRVTAKASKMQVNDLLGLSTLKSGLVLVEDRAAVQFLISILKIKNCDLLAQLEILDAKGATNIDSALSVLPQTSGEWLSVIGVYDGDMRNSVKPKDFKWPHTFLPGNLSPETVLMENLLGLDNNIEVFSADIRIDEYRVRVSMEAVDGLNEHDWYTQLPRRLGCDHNNLMDSLVRIWLIHNSVLADAFVQELITIVNRGR